MTDVRPPVVLARELTVSGEVSAAQDLVVEGRVRGRVRAGGRAVIDERADVEARVEARGILVLGRTQGALEASEDLELRSSAIVDGPLRARTVRIAEGARVRGRLETPLELPDVPELAGDLGAADFEGGSLGSPEDGADVRSPEDTAARSPGDGAARSPEDGAARSPEDGADVRSPPDGSRGAASGRSEGE